MLDSALDQKAFVYHAARDNNLGALKVSVFFVLTTICIFRRLKDEFLIRFCCF